MGKIQGFLSVILSKARDNSTRAVSWLAELTVTLLSPSFPPLSSVCPSQKPPCVDSKRPRVYQHQSRATRHTTHTTQHTTQHHTETERHRDRQKQRETEKETEKEREDETIKEKKLEDERGEKRR